MPTRDKTADKGQLVTGVCTEAVAAYCAALSASDGFSTTVVLTSEPQQAETLANEIVTQAHWRADEQPPQVLHFPELPPPDIDPARRIARKGLRLSALNQLLQKPEAKRILVATPEAIMGPCIRPDQLTENKIELRTGESHSFSELIALLTGPYNYDSEALCEFPGQIATRGGLIDLFPYGAPHPFRIDFFGDEIESIRSFDPLTQRTLDHSNELFISGDLKEATEECAEGTFLSYLPEPKIHWLLHEPSRLHREHPLRFDPSAAAKASLLPFLKESLAKKPRSVSGICQIDSSPVLFEEATRIEAATQPVTDYVTQGYSEVYELDPLQKQQNARKHIQKQIAQWAEQESRDIFFAVSCDEDITRIENSLKENPQTADLHPVFLEGHTGAGFIAGDSGIRLLSPPSKKAPGKKIALLNASEYLGTPAGRHTAKTSQSTVPRPQIDQMLDFAELAPGDALVHLQHGICLYRGLTRLDRNKNDAEVISVEFADKVLLHIPLHQSHLLTRYIGLNKRTPKLSKIGGAIWEKTRSAAEIATLDYAAQLLELQAARQEAKGCACPPDHPWQKALEEAFPFQETQDQLLAIEATKADMEKDRPMDRLICGDVGFGKTEVALRAALKAALSGRQVAILVPTTVLCQQHANTFSERFAGLPINIGTVSRFYSAAQNKKTIQQAAEGRIDILIGTHRLLSKDVHFNQLGLIIIDEEQRFGVKQKEALKKITENCHLLTLSATPIPRTLHMALSGARSMSVIETPPVDRKPIQTIVRSYEPDLVKQAIRTETERGGQVFYLHNQVASIEAVASRLREMHPDLKIAVGHGQMGEDRLEQIMTRFVAGDFDVLVCTTIIESGIDIPNCNTLIIEGADRFGLAQLYQIRGRVGRFKRQAYAYLLLHRHAALVEKAAKRLNALRQHNQLGAGLRIAMRDLELRGAGNLLGAQQSGHIAGVGFELYCQLLQQSVARLKEQPEAAHIRAEIRLDCITGGEGAYTHRNRPSIQDFAKSTKETTNGKTNRTTEAILPEDYIPEAKLRIDLYRRLALSQSSREVQTVEEELKDRFGALPSPVQVLIAVTKLRIEAERSGIRRVETDGNRLVCQLANAGKNGPYFKSGSRFPRLTRKDPLAKIQEIEQILKRIART
ncbi:MAG: transcription-repair coupling factor [Coraliomargaritaceae bacterium]